MGKRQKVILPPQLPPEIDEDELELSDEDFEFVRENEKYTGFLENLKRETIDKHVTRVADRDEGQLEALYEKRNRKAALWREQEKELQVDPVDALPIKTLEGELVYKTAEKARSEHKVDGVDPANQRGKLKNKKEDKKLQKTEAQIDVRNGKLHSKVLEKVQEELSAEESFEKKKAQLAEMGMTILEDPESNIRSLNDMLHICNDKDRNIVKLGLMSLLAVFRDIIPSYRIRQLTEKELTVEVSKEVKKMRYYEYTLVRSYKAFLQKLVALEKNPSFHRVTVRCMCTLLDTAPHFNFRENLLASIIRNLSSSDDVVRKLCSEAIKYLFVNEGKHRGEATIEAVRLIADHVKFNDCQLHPDSIEVLLSLRFDEDIGKNESKEIKEKPKKSREIKEKPKKHKEWQNQEGSKQLPVSDKNKSRRELISKTREEVDADLRAASFSLDPKERRRMQTETLSAVFETYFRILKHSINTSNSRSTSNVVSSSGSHPLLAPCLDGLGKFSHLIDLDFMGELMACLKKLAGYTEHRHDARHENMLSVSERLQCCIVAFKVLRGNLEALNVDLQDFFVQLYNLIMEYRPGRDRGEVLADALKTLLWDGRQHDMLRAAAFIKRLATFALSFGSAEAMAALVTLKHLLQKNTKCRNMLENDAGGGSFSCLVAKYDPEATDPYLSGALASVLWELSLLQKHYNPSVSSMVANILSIASLNPTQNPVPVSNANPLQAYMDLSIERELSMPAGKLPSLNCKRKRRGKEFVALSAEQLQKADFSLGEDELKQKLQDHFAVLRDISENGRLRAELNRTLSSLDLYKEYKKQKKQSIKSKSSRKRLSKA